ncbi:FUSC family protein [Coxiella burnetii]|uniref:FUSC family protein n=1 Tax=Coxiella burnetii TaxID=777 RepID=UPI000163A3F0|nr:FUSC family protein [Coxiella burnetii]ATN86025.1 hypothetical protein AYO29_06030 [Coxiella burnetii str. Schperling]EDR35062.1 putative membrane protein [Coxiella burnetii Q321]PHH57800.1 FUSC family protein [Coxiella burnetii]
MSALYNALNIKLKRLSKERVIASFKTALACLIGLIIGELLHLSMPQWVLITIVVVMATTIRIGGTIQKSYFRLLGTLIGAVLAAGTLYLLGDQPTIIHILLILLLAVFSYLASSSSDISQFGLLGATTMVMILDARTPTLKTALDRTLEIFLGIVIAILVTRFIFPAHAKKLLRFSIANTIKQFQALYKLFVTHKLTKESLAEQEKIENNIITDVSKQHTLLQEAVNEDPRVKKYRLTYQAIFLLERKLLRSIYMLRQTILTESVQIHDFFQNQDIIKLNQQIVDLFDFIHAIFSKQTPAVMPPSKEELYESIEKIIQSLSESKGPTYRIINIHAFEFCLEHLVNVLYEIEKLMQKLDSKHDNQHNIKTPTTHNKPA